MSFLIRPCKHFQKAKAGNAQAILKRLEDYLKDNESTPIQILCGFWKDQQEAITYQEIREAVVAGALTIETWNDWSKDYSVLVQNKLRYVWEDAMKAGSVSQPVLSALEGFTFDLSKQNVINWIQHHGAEFVTVVTQEQKGAISALLARSVREKHSVDELAKFIRPCIGLTEPQAKANLRYYENMVASLKEQHPRMKSESVQKKAREAAAKYAEKQHRYRAMTIAQTEMATAYNKGADEAIRQAQAQKLMGTVIKRWCTSGDDMVCDQCRALEGLELAMDDKFQMGSGWNAGENLTPPAHPRCACAVEYIEVESPTYTDMNNVDDIFTDTETGMQKLGEIDIENVEEALEYYENLFRNDTVENILVIDKEGNVFHAKGTESNVNINIDKIDLVGAFITHNHPKSNGIVSFGENDFYFLREYQNIAEMRCVNEEYDYVISVLKDMSKVSYNDIYREALQYFNEEGFEVQHRTMEVLKERGYVRYVRKKIN